MLHSVILRFSLPFSDSRDPTLISDLNVSSRAAHLVSSAITAGSPCGCSAELVGSAGRNPVREPSFIDSFHQVIASNQLFSLGVKGRVPFCPKTFFILIGERLSRGKVLHIGPADFFISLAFLVRLAPFGWGPPRGLDRLG